MLDVIIDEYCHQPGVYIPSLAELEGGFITVPKCECGRRKTMYAFPDSYLFVCIPCVMREEYERQNELGMR